MTERHWAYEVVYVARIYDENTGQVLQDIPAYTEAEAERVGTQAVEIFSSQG